MNRFTEASFCLLFLLYIQTSKTTHTETLNKPTEETLNEPTEETLNESTEESLNESGVIVEKSSKAVAYVCIDAKDYMRQVQSIHIECRRIVRNLVTTRSDCNLAYFVFGVCHNRLYRINNKFQQIDHKKFMELLQFFAVNKKRDTFTRALANCEHEIFFHEGDLHPYFDCIQVRCPEISSIRYDYYRASRGICTIDE